MANTNPSILKRFDSGTLLHVTAFLLGLIYFFVPAGRFHGSIPGISFSIGYDAFKLVPYPFVTWIIWRWKQPEKFVIQSNLLPPFIVLFLITLISGTASPNGWQALADSLEMLFYLGFLIMLLDIPWTPQLLKIVAMGFVAGNLFLASTILKQYFSATDMNGIVRISGTFTHPNVLGIYAILGFSLLLWLTQYIQNPIYLFWTRITAVVLVFSIFMTQSRTGLIALAVWGLTAAWMGTRKQRKITVCVFIAVLLTAIIITPQIFSRFYTLGKEVQDVNLVNRPLIWQQYFQHELPRLSPFGVGMGPVSTYRFGDWIASQSTSATIIHTWGPHNTYIAWLIGTGFIGLFVLLWLFKVSWDNMQRCEPFTRMVLSSGFLSYAAYCLFHDPFLHGNIPLAWITLIVIASRLAKNDLREDTK